jgi:ribosomal protein S5
MQSEKTASGQATWRAGRRERYGFAVVSGDRAGMVRTSTMKQVKVNQ